MLFFKLNFFVINNFLHQFCIYHRKGQVLNFRNMCLSIFSVANSISYSSLKDRCIVYAILAFNGLKCTPFSPFYSLLKIFPCYFPKTNKFLYFPFVKPLKIFMLKKGLSKASVKESSSQKIYACLHQKGGFNELAM